jgi:hypothetical protein
MGTIAEGISQDTFQVPGWVARLTRVCLGTNDDTRRINLGQYIDPSRDRDQCHAPQSSLADTPSRLAADASGAPGRLRLLATRRSTQVERWKRKSSRAVTVFDASHPANDGPSVPWAPLPPSLRESSPRAWYPGGGDRFSPTHVRLFGGPNPQVWAD